MRKYLFTVILIAVVIAVVTVLRAPQADTRRIKKAKFKYPTRSQKRRFEADQEAGWSFTDDPTSDPLSGDNS